MPYIITTRTPYHDEEHGADSIDTRTAVATLDEARHAVFCTDAVTLAPTPDYARVANRLHEMTEAGGTVGPLPDGTVIEVKHAPLNPFADAQAWCEIYNRHHGAHAC